MISVESQTQNRPGSANTAGQWHRHSVILTSSSAQNICNSSCLTFYPGTGYDYLSFVRYPPVSSPTWSLPSGCTHPVLVPGTRVLADTIATQSALRWTEYPLFRANHCTPNWAGCYQMSLAGVRWASKSQSHHTVGQASGAPLWSRVPYWECRTGTCTSGHFPAEPWKKGTPSRAPVPFPAGSAATKPPGAGRHCKITGTPRQTAAPSHPRSHATFYSCHPIFARSSPITTTFCCHLIHKEFGAESLVLFVSECKKEPSLLLLCAFVAATRTLTGCITHHTSVGGSPSFFHCHLSF